MSVEKREWTCSFENNTQIHEAHLVTELTPNPFEAITEVLAKLNKKEVNPQFPERYFQLDKKFLEALNLERKLRFIAIEKETECQLFLAPSLSWLEFTFSSVPKKAIAVIGLDQSHLILLKIFGLEIDPQANFYHGYIQPTKDGGWQITGIFDRAGWGPDEYKEKLRSLGCPVEEE